MSYEKKDAKSYGLAQTKIPVPPYIPQYGEVMLASDESNGGLITFPESKGKRIISITGGNKKLFIFQVQNQTERIVSSLHPESEDYLQYKGEEILPINEIVMALQGNVINEIRSGKEHNVIITEQGLLYSFGKGNFGSLGLGGSVFSPGPQLITKLRNKKIVSVACGMYHTLALSEIGDVYSWGRGFQGQLGLLQNIQSSSSPQYVTHFFRYDNSKEVRMLRKTSIVSIACGSYHSIAIDSENQIYCWGEARFGQTGNGKKSKEQTPKLVNVELDGQKKKIVKAEGGFGHTLCLTSQGQIFAWGLNIKGQLGLNDLPQNIKSSEGHLNYVKAAYKPMLIKQSRDKTSLPKFKQIACGFTSSFAIDEQGNSWAWGGGNIGFKDKFLERGPVRITETTQNKKFTKVFANQNSMILFCPLSPLYFKPALVPSSGKTELTFFGNGFTDTGLQTVRFTVQEDKIQAELSYDQKTNTFYCRTPVFEKVNKKYSYPLLCKVQVSLDKKQYFSYQKSLLIYSSKLQIQSIEPNCGSVLGGSLAKLYMPIPSLILDYIDSITVGFKNTKASSITKPQKQVKNQSNEDWICTEGNYQNEVISCKIPNIPHFNHQNPFYMIDVSLNGQDFTQFPHTFRYYFITQTKIDPHEGEDDSQPECRIKGNGLFDTPNKQLFISLVFSYKETKINCERKVDLKWNKTDKYFEFKMPKLSWIIGDHELKTDLLEEARKQPCILSLILGHNQVIQIGKYVFKLPPPPPQPQQDKKDAKKDNKKAAKK